MGVVVEFPRCVSCTREPLRRLEGGRQLSGTRCTRRPASAGHLRTSKPKVSRRVLSASAETTQKDGSVAESSASAEIETTGKHSLPSFGTGTGEAPSDVVRVRAVM
jgi:hypothetical protein